MCYRPIFLKQQGTYVPCSKCPKCIRRRVSGWSFRLMQEDRISTSSHFLTLTYDTKFVPISASGKLTLQKEDLQLFFKRLRKAQCGNAQSPIKYYAVGEYGGRTQRPHYHIIMFNADLDFIQPAWKQGHIYYGSVSGASVGYTLKYMSKQKKGRIGTTPNDDRVPEFAVMSKGLGVSYLDETTCNWHVEDLTGRMYCTLAGGVKIAMPRYYKEKLYFEMEKSAISEFYKIQAHAIAIEKLSKQTPKSVRAEQAAIDAAFDRMYSSSLKTVV